MRVYRGDGLLFDSLHQKLQQRYWQLVAEHLHTCADNTNGLSALGGERRASASCLAMARFWKHPATTCAVLSEPLRELLRQQLRRVPLVLCVHDWCALSYTHQHKHDRRQRSHAHDVGYDLLSALLVSATSGQPLGVMELQLRTRRGIIGTGTLTRTPAVAHLEQLLPVMTASRTWRLDPRLIHVIDREADSVGHYRQWAAQGHYFLVRGDDRCVRWQGNACCLSAIVRRFRRTKRFARQDAWSGDSETTQMWLAHTEVVLHKPAKKNVRGVRWKQPGRPLSLRFVMSQLRQHGRVQAEWWLLSNVPESWANACQLTQWYYWRWQIETYHKLMKSAGHQVENWLQATGERVAKRLLVANMACALVWRLQRDDTPRAQQLREVLIALSGRQMKGHRADTASALLNGLEKLLAVLTITERIPLPELKELLENQMPELFQGAKR